MWLPGTQRRRPPPSSEVFPENKAGGEGGRGGAARRAPGVPERPTTGPPAQTPPAVPFPDPSPPTNLQGYKGASVRASVGGGATGLSGRGLEGWEARGSGQWA